MIKFLIGGSPCARWSIAQSKNREVTAQGEGYDLFKNFLIAKERFKPDFFLYENVKSASAAIKAQISKELGVPLQYINSSLVSAQNRERFYAHNFGEVPQPTDRMIMLQDVLEQEAVADEVSYSLHDGCEVRITDNSMRMQRLDAKRSTVQGTHVTLPTGKTQVVSTNHIPMTFEAIAPKEKFE